MATTLLCVECGRADEIGDAWKAVIVDDPDEDRPTEIAVYCPACWEREIACA
jgi:hypothetical protein